MPDASSSKSAIALFLDRARAEGGARPLHLHKHDGTWRTISWHEAAETVRRVAAALVASGFPAGGVAAIVSTNRPEWHAAELGTLAAGGVTTAGYPNGTAADTAHVLDHSAAWIAFAEDREQAEKILAHSHPALHEVVVFAEDDDRPAGTTAWSSFLARGTAALATAREEIDRRIAALDRDSPLTIIYTSGTTGPPKGAVLTHGNVLSVCDAIFRIVAPVPGDLILSFLPLAHALERVGGLYVPVAAGASVAFAESLETVAANMVEVRPTFVSAVPRFFEKAHARVQEALATLPARRRRLLAWGLGVGRRRRELLEAGRPLPLRLRLEHLLADRLVLAKVRARFGGRIRYFVSGGAPLAADVGRFFADAGLLILEGYGATETAAPVTMNRPGDIAFGTVGRPLAGVELRFDDDGEILVRGPNVFPGYWNNPDATAAVLEDGWYRTGDIGRLDDAGHLVITDRKRDIIVTAGGKNVAPQNLEQHLKASGDLAEVVVLGDRRRFLSAVVMPAEATLRRWAEEAGLDGLDPIELLARPEIRARVDALLEERNASLASHERVRKAILVGDALLPGSELLTPTLKVRRRRVEERYRAELDALYR